MQTWLPSAIFSLVVGILGYFIKRTLDNFSKSQEAQREEFKIELSTRMTPGALEPGRRLYK